jgi:chromosome segregation ATPase
MADDQLKYSDLIAQDVQPGLTMLAEALKAVAEQIASLKTEATALKGAMSAAGTATREQQQATAQQAASVEGLSKKVKQLTEEERRLEDVRKRYKKLTDEQIERVNAFQQALRGSTQQQMAAVNAIEVETKSYNELNAMYNALKDSLNAMTVA